jgi:hypothetical protein
MLQFPEAVFNDAATALRGEALASVFGDICAVKRSGPGLPAINQPGIAAFIRGLEQLLLDMYDEPEGLHALLRFITDGLLSLLRQLENSGRLTLNNKNHYVDSGGNGYTGKLPAGGYNGAARLKDLWGFGLAQEYSDVSPDMHAEFGFRYQAEAMALFGANAYGCCEPLTYKFEAAKKLLPNLRRVSVSPWCDARRAAEALGEQYILSLKPNPAIVLLSDDLETVRGHVRALLEATKGCYAEVFLKDCMRLKGKEQRLVDFVNITRQEIGRL